jgi:predicted unusual protein kinase regulating ubiquinone biosynthesis (AarF/ABC1/UbiB family)
MVDLFRRLNADDSAIVIPRVYHSLTTRRVLTLEYIEGQSYADFCSAAEQPRKNAAGLTIFRFTFRSMLLFGVLYADPHPGNYRFLRDGRVAFLDFGCVKELSPELVLGMKRYMRAALDEDWAEFDRACVEVLGFDPADDSWDTYREYTLELLAPLISVKPWQCSPEKAREHVQQLLTRVKGLALKGNVPHVPLVPNLPQEFTFVNRLQWGLASVLAGLRTEACFRAAVEPWIRSGLLKPPE